ncbi:coenzyme B12-dependent glutamate mutase GlmES, E (epsilon) subunit [Malaciobacter marinus]|uniref:Coenzyme B12-dependent glutamate mutase GlmES, E (Epsilon) subunit n=1 Tax=Malaciobacter marinus TaxID=505249 RepID=A0A347TL12_9BACT|nr:methylaspartate mutase [Malaciobacter marinus]AXX87290.1 coenzyme B12-dependent glutamate mutase GlmES, E (epsilon) subunit [Malaciobacter marinus]PHO15545.1 methylaspartate mutase [Malaciobacter marinus]
MSLLQEEREIIVQNEYADSFDFQEIEEFVKNASKNLFISHNFKNKNKMLVQPRGGFPTYEKQFALNEFFVKANVDVLPLTIDSNTRLNDYAMAKKMLRLSEENEVDMLNGYPLVNHGYRTTRKMITHFDKPVSLRHGTPDARLLIETAIASGIFEIEGGPITYLLPYSKNFPLDKAFLYWKYVERVCANYSKLNEPINRESFGPLTATLVPPCITIVIQLLEMLLSLEEGVKSFSVSFSQTGSVNQDIVTSAVLKKMAKYYAKEIDCEDAQINLVYHQWMGAFPSNKDYSESLINTSTVIAALVKADKIITKTRDEAFGIPTKEANAKTVANTQYTLRILQGLPNIINEQEEEILTQEVKSIMEAVFNDSADTLWRKVFNSIKNGTIDVPFSPHIINNNEVVTVRDKDKNIRIIKRGNLPISDKCFEYEKSKCNLNKDATSIVNDIIHDIGIMQ